MEQRNNADIYGLFITIIHWKYAVNCKWYSIRMRPIAYGIITVTGQNGLFNYVVNGTYFIVTDLTEWWINTYFVFIESYDFNT